MLGALQKNKYPFARQLKDKVITDEFNCWKDIFFLQTVERKLLIPRSDLDTSYFKVSLWVSLGFRKNTID